MVLAVTAAPTTPAAKPMTRPRVTVVLAPESMRRPWPVGQRPRSVLPPRFKVTPAATASPSAGHTVRVTGSVDFSTVDVVTVSPQ